MFVDAVAYVVRRDGAGVRSWLRAPPLPPFFFLGILSVFTSGTAKTAPLKQIEADSGWPRGASLIFAKLTRLQVPLIASSQGIETSDDKPAGRLQLDALTAVAEFERGIIKECVNPVPAAAKARGVRLGRSATINGRAVEVRKLKTKGLGLRPAAVS